MKSKNVLTAGLLVFVVVSLIAVAFRGGEYEEVPSDGVIAYYFHTDHRCEDCVSMQKYGEETVNGSFADDIEAGRLHWRIVNFQEPQNEQYVKDYELAISVIVLVEMKAGEPIRSKTLIECLQKVGDKADYVNYVREGIETFLKGATQA